MPRNPPAPANTVIITHQSTVLDRHLAPPLLGLWVFLLGAASVFAALFLAFALAFDQFQASFASAAEARSGLRVAINGGLMLAAGLAMAGAVRAHERRQANRLTGYLGATLLSLVGFIGARLHGYYQAYQAGLVSFGNRPFTFNGPSPHDALLFFNFYFVLSALHTVLIFLGVLALAAVLRDSIHRRPPSRFDARLTAAGVYASFLILLWLGLFFAFYLSGRY